MPMAALAVGGNVANAFIGGRASKKAAEAQQQAAERAYHEQRALMSEVRGNFSPYMETGKGAVLSLAQLYGLPTPSNPNGGQPYGQESLDAFKRSPDYEFARQQGMEGLTFSAAAQGLLRSRGHLNETVRFNQGLATQNFGNYRNALMDLSKIGAQSTGQFSSIMAGMGNQQSSNLLASGNAQAGGIMGQANALSGGINGVINSVGSWWQGGGGKSAFANMGGAGGSGFYQGNPHVPGGIGDPSYWGNMPAVATGPNNYGYG
jgi:hypothetical protein